MQSNITPTLGVDLANALPTSQVSRTLQSKPRNNVIGPRRGRLLVACNAGSPFKVLELTGKFLPQGQLVKVAKSGWRELWLTFMRELAPQNKAGSYSRPGYTFQGRIGNADFPAESGRYVLYLGEIPAALAQEKHALFTVLMRFVSMKTLKNV